MSEGVRWLRLRSTASAIGPAADAAAVGVAGGEVLGELGVAPGADAGQAVAGDVVGLPAGGDRAGVLAAVVQGLGQVARRVAVAAVGHGLGQIGAAVPLRAAVRVRLEALVGIEQPAPDRHQPALVEGESRRCSSWSGRCTGGRLNR